MGYVVDEIDPTFEPRLNNLENNVYKITYYEIISGTSGSITPPANSTINSGEFGLSGNAILSKIDGSNKPTFQTPKDSGGNVVTASLNVGTNAWVASGTYTDSFVALIYSVNILAKDFSSLNNFYIIESIELIYDLNANSFGSFINTLTGKSILVDADLFSLADSAASFILKKVTLANVFSYIAKKFENKTNGGNAAYSILVTDNIIYTGTAFTAPRIWSLPTASGVNPGHEKIVADFLQTVTSVNTLTIGVQTGEYFNGVLNGTEVMTSAGGQRRLISDGVNGWYTDLGIVRLNATQTLSNKRITQRISSITSSATPTPNADTDDLFKITALAAAALLTNPTGTPTAGQALLVRIKDNGTARALTFDTLYRFSSDQPAPTTTIISKTIYLGFVYNVDDTKWDCIGWISNI